MAAKGQAAKSASGASMSKYDVEVEARLKKIESEIGSIKEGLEKHSHVSSGGDGGKVDKLIEVLNQCEAVTQYYPKGADGVRKIDI